MVLFALPASRFPLPPSPFPLPALVKVPRGVGELLHLELAEFLANDIPHSPIALELSLDRHESRELYHLRILLDEPLGYDHVDEPKLVFHQQEHRALCALRLLADGDESSRSDPLSTFELLELA